MSWLRGCLSRFNPFAQGVEPPIQIIGANPGPYDKGVSPDPSETGAYLILENEAFLRGHGIYPSLAPTQPAHELNLPPLIAEGSAQRDHPQILNLAEMTPIGTGVPPQREWFVVQGSDAVFDIQAWAQGLGQVANQIGLVYAAANIAGQGQAQGAGITQMPFELPAEFTVAYVSTDGSPLTIANPSGLPFGP